MNFPRAARIPAQSAADCPQWNANRCTRIRESAAANSFNVGHELSVLQSSVKTISYWPSDDFIASRIAATSGRRFAVSLWHGMTKLIVGFSLPIVLKTAY